MTTGEDTHGCDYFTSIFLLPQLCNSTVTTPEAIEEAEVLLAQAMAGDLTFEGPQPDINGYAVIEREGFYGYIQRGPKTEADQLFALLDSYGIDPAGALGPYWGPRYGDAYGSAAVVDEEYVYYVFALLQ